MLAKAFLYSGSETPKPMALRAGPLTMVFEPHTACLRHIRLGDHEVVRALYAAVRDQDWATLTPRVTLRDQNIKTDSFHLDFDCLCQRGAIDYFWEGVVSGDANGRVRFSFEGVARSDFLRNRIGLCILHPITECAGKPVTIEHVSGSLEQGSFPRDIS